jgi:hypothetical protein
LGIGTGSNARGCVSSSGRFPKQLSDGLVIIKRKGAARQLRYGSSIKGAGRRKRPGAPTKHAGPKIPAEEEEYHRQLKATKLRGSRKGN